MPFKEKLKSVIPEPLYAWLRTQKHKANLTKLYQQQARDFARYSSIEDRESQDHLAALLVFLSHRIEKGLSHSDFRPQFGRSTLVQLGRYANAWVSKRYPDDAFEFRLAMAALKAYRDRHLESDCDLPDEYVRSFSSLEDIIDSADRGMSGTIVTRADSTSASTYPEVLRLRHSIREYGIGTPDISDVIEAIEVAMSAPSVCNRQSQRVTLVSSRKEIEAILDAQGGWKGYAYPPMLLVISSSLASFVSSTERNEPYVDGGIFTMALLGALEWKGLAACPLNAMFEIENERAVRHAASVPDGEALICIVTIGLKPEEVQCPRSARKSSSDIIRFVE